MAQIEQIAYTAGVCAELGVYAWPSLSRPEWDCGSKFHEPGSREESRAHIFLPGLGLKLIDWELSQLDYFALDLEIPDIRAFQQLSNISSPVWYQLYLHPMLPNCHYSI